MIISYWIFIIKCFENKIGLFLSYISFVMKNAGFD